MLKIGELVDGKYKIIKLLGRGGTSCVFMAQNIRLGNYWAIKEVYKSNPSWSKTGNNVLIAESRILTRLRHPGLPTIVDIIEKPEASLVIMEYIEGISLDSYIEKNGAQSEANVRKWGIQLCEVLQYLHDQTPPIIYRDMKPANIMLKPDGNIALIDFGMAREFKYCSFRDTELLGTHGYAAPEQYDIKCQSDERTDIYGLGMTLYHLITGQDPCVPPYAAQPIQQYNPHATKRMEEIIRTCTQLNPQDRYVSAEALKVDLSRERILFDEESEDKAPKGKGMMWAILIAVVLILAITIVAITTSDGNSGGQKTQSDYLNLFLPWAEQQVEIAYAGECKVFNFTPLIDGYYRFYTVTNQSAPVAWLYDENYEPLSSDNTYGKNTDMYIEYWLEEGVTYHLETTLYYLNEDIPSTGSYTIHAELVE